MSYPAYRQFRFQGNWEEYKLYKAMRGELVQVVNAKDTDDDGSMIQEGQGTGTEVNPQSWTQHLLFICEEEH